MIDCLRTSESIEKRIKDIERFHAFQFDELIISFCRNPLSESHAGLIASLFCGFGAVEFPDPFPIVLALLPVSSVLNAQRIAEALLEWRSSGHGSDLQAVINILVDYIAQYSHSEEGHDISAYVHLLLVVLECAELQTVLKGLPPSLPLLKALSGAILKTGSSEKVEHMQVLVEVFEEAIQKARDDEFCEVLACFSHLVVRLYRAERTFAEKPAAERLIAVFRGLIVLLN
jgi:hypothetical protein